MAESRQGVLLDTCLHPNFRLSAFHSSLETILAQTDAHYNQTVAPPPKTSAYLENPDKNSITASEVLSVAVETA